MRGIDRTDERRFFTAAAGGWVVERPFHADAPGSPGEPCSPLLLDQQFWLAGSEHFTRTVQRLDSSEGVQQLSQLDLAFDPQVESLTVHAIRLWRDGVAHDRLDAERIQLLQREQSLDRQIYDGRVSALALIEDVRVGDVLDVSYTRRRDHEAYAEHFFSILPLQWPVRIEAFRLSIIAPAGNSLRWQTEAQEAFDPQVSEFGEETLYEWSLDQVDELTVVPEAPWWYPVLPRLQVSDWESWEEVGRWVFDLWNVQLAHEDLSSLAATFQEGTTDPEVMAQRAVDFVQQEIRYLGLEDGIGSFRPSAPAEVLRRRFGDCKDKSLLLSTLLRLLKVPAAPVLVSGRLGKGVENHLPMPAAFDHVIVRLQVGGRNLWFDATDAHARGPLHERWPPEFGFGLQIHSKSPTLVPIPASIPDGTLLRVREDYELGVGERPAQLALHTLARGLDATRIRGQYAALGATKFAAAYEDGLRAHFPKTERVGELRLTDHAARNEIEIAENFSIPNFTRLADNGQHRIAIFTPMPLRDRLVVPAGKEHACPWPLAFPCVVRNRIRVTMPWRTSIDAERTRVENEHANFEFRSRQLNEKTVEILFGYDSTCDHVPVEKLGRYRADFERMSNSSAYILALDGSARPSWDKSAGGGGQPGAVREKTRVEHDSNYGKSPNLAWAGGGVLFFALVWLVFKVLPMTGSHSSGNEVSRPTARSATDPAEMMQAESRTSDASTEMDSELKSALDEVTLGTGGALMPTNDPASRSENSFGTSLDFDGSTTDETPNAPSIEDSASFRFD